MLKLLVKVDFSFWGSQLWNAFVEILCKTPLTGQAASCDSCWRRVPEHIIIVNHGGAFGGSRWLGCHSDISVGGQLWTLATLNIKINKRQADRRLRPGRFVCLPARSSARNAAHKNFKWVAFLSLQSRVGREMALLSSV